MYQSFIHYIVVILIYTARPARPPELFATLPETLLIAVLISLFIAFVRFSCRRLEKAAHNLNDDLLSLNYDRLINRLQIAALLTFAALVYGADLGNLIARLPMAAGSEAISSLLGLGFFLFLQIIIWNASHRIFATRLALLQPRSAYLKARLRFALGLIGPWLGLMTVVDVISVFLPPEIPSLLQNPLSEVLLFVIFLLLLTAIAPPLLVFLWRCQKMPDGQLRRAIIELCRRQRVGWREIMLWPPYEGRMATAAVVGAFPWSRYLLVTPDLLRLLNGNEVIAVMSHELGHVRYRHLLYFLLFFATFFLFNYLYFDLGLTWILTTEPVATLIDRSGVGDREVFLSLLEVVPLLFCYLIFFRYIFGYFLRNFERQADLACLDLPGLAPHLVSAFSKLGYVLGSAGKKPNWHHFNIPQRLDFLQQAMINPFVARRHHRRIKRSLVIYLLIFLLLTIPGIYWQKTDLRGRLQYRYLSQRLEKLVYKNPQEARLWLALSSLYLEQGKDTETISALEKTLQLSPDNPDALNNLAWLLLTAQDESRRDYIRGLQLAEKAAGLNPASHILDTLAEARWRNGDKAGAIALEKEILEQPDLDNREHYQRQLEKFTKEIIL